MNNAIRSLSSRFVRFMLFLMLIFVVSDYVDARPGGGSSSQSRNTNSNSNSNSGGGGSYSGGGSSNNTNTNTNNSTTRSSGSNNSSDSELGELIGELIVGLFLLLPASVQYFLLIILGLFFVYTAIKNISFSSSSSASTSYRPQEESKTLQTMQAVAQKNLANVKQTDPNFSETLFLDYVQNVFHQYYSALGRDKIGNLKPFFIDHVNTADKHKYTEIVINALYIIGLDTTTIKGENYDRIKVMLETNFTQTAPNNSRRLRYLSEQEWHFVRLRNVVSLPPAKMQALACPSCGAPESFKNDTQCGACGTVIEPAAMQWAVQLQKRIFDESYETNALVSYAEEMGTNNATIYAPNLKEMQTAFEKLHDIASTNTYFTNFSANVVQPAFMAIYAAWTAKNLAPIRHLISDFLYQTQDFWIQEYKAQGLTNHLDDIKISGVELAKIEIDKFYETFTVRIFASCKDYTTKDKSNAIVGGDKKKSRAFSEYWTFVRRIGTEQKPKDSLDLHACPSCAAPLDKMGMTGICGYCSHKVSSGDYSWVLSRITQDEAYN
jgi:predicted lipid-binding transport protein (Tim44 family)